MEFLQHSAAFSGFAVKDLAAAKTFYTETLGLPVTEHTDMPVLTLRINHGNTPVFIYPKPNHQPATYTILNFPVPDIDATVDALTAKGIRFLQYEGAIKTDGKGIVRGGKPEIAWFTDPSGNILSVIQQQDKPW
ncbi:MAG TPA: VOC family protein [Chitinophaga sp.]